VKQERFERYLRSFISENRKAHTMKIEDESPQFLKHRFDDLISKKDGRTGSPCWKTPTPSYW
jgi:hypothetical protein